MSSRLSSKEPSRSFSWHKKGSSSHTSSSESESKSLCVLFLLPEISHGAEAVSSEAAQPAQVLGRLPALATITFVFTAA
jgi:hypothetical protein